MLPCKFNRVVEGIEKVLKAGPPCILFPMESVLTDTKGA
jgi:hypothetical protein